MRTPAVIRAVVSTSALLAAAAASGREDFEYWSNWTVSYDVSDVSTLTSFLSARFRDDMSDDYLYVHYLTYARDMGRGFGLFLQTQLVWLECDDEAWESKQSMVLGAKYEFEVPGFAEVKVQDRVYYRIDSPSQWDHHRPRIALSRDWGRWTLSVYDEFRFDLTGERDCDHFRNRMGASVSRDVTRRLSVGLGYARTADNNRFSRNWSNAFLTSVSVGF